MDELADDVQPDEGQGDSAASDAPYAEYLNRIPEEVRADVEPVFKDWDANVTRRFQESSEYRKQWEPYEQAGLNNASPEAVQWALQFYEAAQNDPQSIQQWYEEYARERGITPAQAAQELNTAADEYGGEYQDPTAQLLEQQLGPLQQQLQELRQWQEQQAFKERLHEAERFVDNELKALEEKHGDEFNREGVERFVAQYIESNPQQAVQLAWADYQSLVNQIQKQTLQSKVDAPAPAEGGGVADYSPENISSLEQAHKIAMAQIAERNRHL